MLWRANMLARVETINTMSRRICAIKLCTDSFSILFVNVYMPYEDGSDRSDDFCVHLSVIDNLIGQHANCHGSLQ